MEKYRWWHLAVWLGILAAVLVARYVPVVRDELFWPFVGLVVLGGLIVVYLMWGFFAEARALPILGLAAIVTVFDELLEFAPPLSVRDVTFRWGELALILAFVYVLWSLDRSDR